MSRYNLPVDLHPDFDRQPSPAKETPPPVPTTETEALFADLSKPALHTLSYALRHPETWPKDFVWNYVQCDKCAMGLAHSLWIKSVPTPRNSSLAENINVTNMARVFGISYTQAYEIFYGYHSVRWTDITTGHWPFRKTTQTYNQTDITPDMVADTIDAYLKTKE